MQSFKGGGTFSLCTSASSQMCQRKLWTEGILTEIVSLNSSGCTFQLLHGHCTIDHPLSSSQIIYQIYILLLTDSETEALECNPAIFQPVIFQFWEQEALSFIKAECHLDILLIFLLKQIVFVQTSEIGLTFSHILAVWLILLQRKHYIWYNQGDTTKVTHSSNHTAHPVLSHSTNSSKLANSPFWPNLSNFPNPSNSPTLWQ